MSYLPRPDAARTSQDVDDIYALTAEKLQHASTPEERRRAFKEGLVGAYGAGVDAQREILRDYSHDRPTPVPPPPDPADVEGLNTDPGTLPPNRAPRITPPGSWRGPKRS